MDCCRTVFYKGIPAATPAVTAQPTFGQFYLLNSTSPGNVTPGILGDISPVTKSFITHLQSTTLPWPDCLSNWPGRKAELVSKCNQNLKLYMFENMAGTKLQQGTPVTGTLPQIPGSPIKIMKSVHSITPTSPEPQFVNASTPLTSSSNLTQKISTWTTDHVCDWLKSLNMKEENINKVKEEEITGESLIHLTDEQWRACGFKLGQIVVLKANLQKLELGN